MFENSANLAVSGLARVRSNACDQRRDVDVSGCKFPDLFQRLLPRQ